MCSQADTVTNDSLIWLGMLQLGSATPTQHKEFSRGSVPSKIQQFPLPKESELGKARASQPGMAQALKTLPEIPTFG